MRPDDRSDLHSHLQRGVPDVPDRDVSAGWAVLQSRISDRSRKKVGRTRRIVVACATICLVPAVVLGALLALAGLGDRQSVVRLGEGPTVQTMSAPSTTSTTESETTIKVEAKRLTDAWMKAAELLEFSPGTVYSDRLELDYSLGLELQRVSIHAYTELGELTVRSTATSPTIELLVTLKRSGAETGREVAPQPVLTILDSFEETGGMGAMLSRPEVKQFTTFAMKSTGDRGLADPIYRLTATWEPFGQDMLQEPVFMFVGKPGQDPRAAGGRLFEPLSPKETGVLRGSEFVRLAVSVYRESGAPAQEPASAGAYASRVHFLLPALIKAGDDSSTLVMPSAAVVEAPPATQIDNVDISP
jgi:hypothetical protein